MSTCVVDILYAVSLLPRLLPEGPSGSISRCCLRTLTKPLTVVVSPWYLTLVCVGSGQVQYIERFMQYQAQRCLEDRAAGEPDNQPGHAWQGVGPAALAQQCPGARQRESKPWRPGRG